MGCGNSSSVPVAHDPTVPQNKPEYQQPRVPSARNDVVKRTSSASSHTSVPIAKASTPIKKVKNPSIQSEYNVNQNIVIVWVDANINSSNKTYNDSLTKLQRITTLIYTATNEEQCMNHLDNIGDKKVFLIVSDDLGEKIVPEVHDKPQIDSIYIYAKVKRQRLPWANKWAEKIKKISFDMEDIFQEIKFSSGLVSSLTPISIIRRMDLPNSIDNELDQSFMYTQLLKEILLEMNHDSTLKTKLVEYCHPKYADNILQMGLIDEFNQEYNETLAIHWYTKESFLYSMLNRALRTQDIETIMKMGFFLHDLHEQIVELYTIQSKIRDPDNFFVYRGQGMAPEEMEAIEANKGGLLSFNNFLSTTLNDKIAFRFAENAHSNPHVVAVIFQMEIDPKIQLVPFALVNKTSAYKDEKEILFSMHTIFRIMNARKIQDRF